ncbi:hypothetical protein NSU18_21150 [Paenibacillus sp. FSL H8-0048]|uniref:hypothetical protein n=1 Tax=Paenibacillus sp. FSL H8-0048 TaxID=2954508 RepID=UPI0030F92DD1
MAEACERNVVEKPITIGVAEACERNVVEKPITIGVAEACERSVIEKPITFGVVEACERNVIEKPITIGVAEASGAGCMGKTEKRGNNAPGSNYSDTGTSLIRACTFWSTNVSYDE